MNLANLIKLCQDFDIKPENVGFYGEHDVVYLDLNDEDQAKLPKDEDGQPSTYKEDSNLLEEKFWNEYGIGVIDGYWGSYT